MHLKIHKFNKSNLNKMLDLGQVVNKFSMDHKSSFKGLLLNLVKI